jgi:hypothetical protein
LKFKGMSLSRFYKLTCGALLCLSLGACSSCDKASCDGSKNNGGGTGGGDDGPCPALGDLTVEFVQAFGGDTFCEISGSLSTNATLKADIDWRLDGTVSVGDEAGISASLVIEPGATLKGNIAGTVTEYVYIYPGSSLRAVGTVDAPIIFSSNDDGYSLESGLGEWGGLIIEDSVAVQTNVQLEYFVVAEAGAPVTVAGNDYAANISLYGDHDTSKLRYVQSHVSGSDGISITAADNANLARLEWLLVTGANRDGVHYTNFSGLIKDLLVIHSPGLFPPGIDQGVGGRAGIRAGGNPTKAPLIVNATLVGRDNSQALPGNFSREFGLLFEDGLTSVRIANMAIANFRNGCYEIGENNEFGENVDLSSMALLSPAANDSNFVDGVHCVNETEVIDGSGGSFKTVRFGGGDIPPELQGLGDGEGISFYSGFNRIGFAGESVSADNGNTFTSSWFVDSIAGLANQTIDLRRYNGGDTNDNGVVDIIDDNFSPLFDSNLDPLFGGVFKPAVFIDFDLDSPNYLSPLDPQPTGSFVCGFVQGVSSVEFYCGPAGSSGAVTYEGFSLTVVGAVRSPLDSEATQFDGWTIQTDENEEFRPLL